jgi:hypothetical protein
VKPVTGSWWECDDVKVLVVAVNPVHVWFAWWGPDWYPLIGDTEYDEFVYRYLPIETS